LSIIEAIMKNVAINGFGRMGRLAFRAIADRDDLQVVAINEPNANAEVLSTLLEFDSTQGRWHTACSFHEDHLVVSGNKIPVSNHDNPVNLTWASESVDIVLECSGTMRDKESLESLFADGVKRVVVSVPVKDGTPNIVIGVNDDQFDLGAERIVTAASCTTNCVAPIVKVIHTTFEIVNGLFTTIHNPTNTQKVVDAPHSDPRRARASQLNLIPTSTNSATAVALIFPELKGKLDSIAVRAPVLNASLVDCVFQVGSNTSTEQVNQVLKDAASQSEFGKILGFEERPLVSCDYAGDPRSAIVDASSTRVIGQRLIKILAWYDNEWGYVNRMVELTGMVAKEI
jgi:glyceraldehyde 3-phosphate dehydrogenase